MTKGTWIVALLALSVGAAGGYWAAQPKGKAAATSPVETRKPLFYRAPMNPAVTSKVPAKDEMGMDYVPVYAEDLEKTGPPGTVTIDPVTVQSLGIQTALAEQRTLERTIRTTGRVTYDEKRLSRLHPKVEGWVTKLFVGQTGGPVKRNQELLELYSPQLVTAQQEFLLALDNREILKNSPFPDIRRGAADLLNSSRERLAWLDVAEHQIEALEETRKAEKNLHLHSPFNGIVVNIGAREGAYVTPQTELYMIADLSHVWIWADIYEYELPLIRIGQEARVTLSYDPETRLTAQVTFIYPTLDPKTRTAKVRFELDNPGQKLKPDMYANVEVRIPLGMRLAVPEGAILDSGTRKILFVDRGQGRLEPREIRIGANAEGYYEVREGLAPGERVVTAAAFLIDSESQLRSALGMMGMPGMEMEKKTPVPASPEPEPAKGHSGMHHIPGMP